MTENQDNPQTDTSAVVSETYKAIADERAPEYLNKAILRDAAKAARPRYLRSVSWTRPLAWAATITLSVALVLEVSNLPTPGPAVLEESLAPNSPIAVPQSTPLKSTAKQMAAQPELEKRLVDEGRHETARTREAASDSLDIAEVEIGDTDMLRRADEMARLQDGENKDQAPTAAFAARAPVTAQSAAGLSSAAASCDETARSSAESWHACVLELEDAGLADEARRQREALREAFPDFTPR